MTQGWGLIGIGKLADIRIAPAVAKDRDSRLVAACSRDIGRAEAFARSHNVQRAYDSYPAMLADPDVDIVYIATPNSLHKEQTLAALDAGKHVLVEKPMALTSKDGTEIVAAMSATGLSVGVGFHLRHKATSLAARELIRSNRLGRVFLAEVSIGAGKGVYPYDTWRADPQLAGGGTMLNQGTHVLDLLRFLMGLQIVEVTCFVDADPNEDVFTAVCRLDDGVLATISSQQLHAGTRPEWLIVGENGWLHGRGGTSPREGDEVVLHTAEGLEEQIASSPVSAYDTEIEAFATAVRCNKPVNGSAEDGLRNIEIFEALYQSARERRIVAVAA